MNTPLLAGWNMNLMLCTADAEGNGNGIDGVTQFGVRGPVGFHVRFFPESWCQTTLAKVIGDVVRRH